ncbi:UNVERIFIED_CONTAM: hypothetical protein GTU68_041195 [Idotea baltica]|nr:hypothetical protein [Idotea baltica]
MVKLYNTKVIVVSAQSGITNILQQISSHKKNAQTKDFINQIYQIINPILKNIQSPQIKNRIKYFTDDLLFLSKISLRIYTKKLEDEILSYGERISSLLIKELLYQYGLNVTNIDAKKIIKTNNNFTNAKPDIDLIKRKVETYFFPILNNKKIIIMEGFIGSDIEDNTTTLSRGGSDYTAALISQALNAKILQIWTDVKGIYQIDPNIIKNARIVKTIGFDEAAELATFGAKVLHPSTLWPTSNKNITIFVGSTFYPNIGGTWVKNIIDEKPIIRAITERNNQILLVIKSFNMANTRGFLANIFTLLAQNNINVDLVSTSEISVALTLNPHQQLHEITKSILTEKILFELESIGNIEVSIEENLSLITLVGNNLNKKQGLSGELFSCLHNCNIRLFNHGASHSNICILVKQKDSTIAIQNIYNKIILKQQTI